MGNKYILHRLAVVFAILATMVTCTVIGASTASADDRTMSGTPTKVQKEAKQRNPRTDGPSQNATPGPAPTSPSPTGAATPSPLAQLALPSPSPSPLQTMPGLSTTSPLGQSTAPSESPSDTGVHGYVSPRASGSYSVRFYPGNGEADFYQTVQDGDQLVRPPDPTRAGYLFDGWFSGEGVAFDFSEPINNNISSLSAGWTETSSWTINPVHGPSIGGSDVKLMAPIQRRITFSQLSQGKTHVLAVGSDGKVYAWGDNSNGQLLDGTTTSRTTPVKSNVLDDRIWKQVSTRDTHSLALTSNGDLYAWGDNSKGQLGDNSTTDSAAPVKVSLPATAPGGFVWKRVQAGVGYTVAWGSDNNLYAWGDNSKGQLGDGTTISRIAPVKVNAPAGITWKEFSVGDAHALAVGSDDGIYAWGDNSKGQLGDGTAINKTAPIKVSNRPADTTWAEISAGSTHSLARDRYGNAYAWGDNSKGQLGDGTTVNKYRIAGIGRTGGPSSGPGWASIKAGNGYSVGLSEGVIYGWGDNSMGQLGDGSTVSRTRPTRQSAPDTVYFRKVIAGNASVLANQWGVYYGWGLNDHGQLGDATTINRFVPVKNSFGQKLVTDVRFDGVASTTTPARQSDGTWLATTPAHTKGRVNVVVNYTLNGVETTDPLVYRYDDIFTVRFDSAGGSPAPGDQQVSEGGKVSEPVTKPIKTGWIFDGWFNGDVAYDFNQQVKDDLTLTAHWTKGDGKWHLAPSHGPAAGGTQVVLTPPAPRGIRFTQISTASQYTVALASDGNLYAWGHNSYGLGDGTISSEPSVTPRKVKTPTGVPSGFRWKQVSAGGGGTVLALGSDGNLYSWGQNRFGSLGRSSGDAAIPGKVDKPAGVAAGFTWAQGISGQYSMGLSSNGDYYAWGWNDYGGTGADGGGGQHETPIPLHPNGQNIPSGLTWEKATTRADQGVLLGKNGRLYAWGYCSNGQVGRGPCPWYSPTPRAVLNPVGAPSDLAWEDVSAGAYYTLAVGSDGNLYAWGLNDKGQLGDGTTTNQSIPVPGLKPAGVPEGFTWKQINGGYSHSVAVGSDGNLYAWGSNDKGQLGDGTTNNSNKPVKARKPDGAPAGFTWVQAQAGEGYTVALGSDGNVYSWGANNYGQLGDGTTTDRMAPVKTVLGQEQVTGATFDGTASTTAPAMQADGTWLVTSPAHNKGRVDVKVDSTLNGEASSALLDYRYDGPTYAVRFDPAGGRNGPGDQRVIEGYKASRPNSDPTRAGYLFDGWFNESRPVAYDFEQPVNGNMTLTAHWTQDRGWSVNPVQGPTTGGTRVALTAPAPRGVRFSQVSSRATHSLGVASDGNMYAWGSNANGQLGDGSTTARSAPVMVTMPVGAPAGFSWRQAMAGSSYSMGFGSDGVLYAWGGNANGQLGDGTGTDSLVPVKVAAPVDAPAGFTWEQVAVGVNFCLAFGSDGNLYAWGDNGSGQLGNGTTVNALRPTVVPQPTGVSAGFRWEQIAAGDSHSLALGSDGNLYSWGYNGNGELGDSSVSTAGRKLPGKVSLPTGVPAAFRWEQISATTGGSRAIGSDKNLYAWGDNRNGNLGDGTTISRNRPVKVAMPVGAPSGFAWKRLIAGNQAMILGSDGNLYTSGYNRLGELGDGTNINRSSLVRVSLPMGVPAGFRWEQAALGDDFGLAIGSDGNTYTWGYNDQGRLGDGTTTNRNLPGGMVFGLLQVSDVLFDGVPSTSVPVRQPDGTWLATTPPHVKGPVDVAVRSALDGVASTTHLAYLYVAIHAVHFDPAGGTNGPSDQDVIEGNRIDRPVTGPTRAGWQFDGWFIGDVAYDFNRPVMRNLTLTAHWTAEGGWIIDPHRGPSTGGDQVTLTPPVPRGIRFTQTSSNLYHTLAIGSDGNMYAWGYNSSGQLGDGTTTNSNKPVRVRIPVGAPAGFTWKQASAGEYHSLGLGSDGNLYAWGYNYQGRLGDGTTYTRVLPVKIGSPAGAPVGFTWKQVSAGSGHSLGLGSDGNLYAWGYNAYGQLGNGSSGTDSSLPVKVNTPDGAPAGFAWTDAAAGVHHNVALGSDGNLYAWGDNGSGQLGDGTGVGKSEPVKIDPPASVRTGFAWKQIATRGHHSQALGSDGNLYAWGLNSSGQLGDGSNTTKLAPVKVLPPVGASAGFTWTQVSTGQYHSLALGSDGNLYAWGLNSSGRLGDGTTIDRNAPVGVRIPAGAPAGFAWTGAVAAGMNTLDLGSDGNLYSWGRNTYGELGDGTTTNRDRPTQVAFPDRGRPTGVDFGTAAGTGITAQPDGTWLVDTPAHPDGSVPVTIRWTRNGVAQADDTSNTYRFVTILPLAGGTGILALLLAGLLTMAGVTAARRHRLEVGPTGTGGDA